MPSAGERKRPAGARSCARTPGWIEVARINRCDGRRRRGLWVHGGSALDFAMLDSKHLVARREVPGEPLTTGYRPMLTARRTIATVKVAVVSRA